MKVKNTRTQKKLHELDKSTSSKPFQGRANTKINEKSFMKGVVNNAKSFIKDKLKDVKKYSKDIMRKIRKEYLGGKQRSNFLPGKMISYQYKAKDTTKTYDRVPLGICLGPPKNKKLQKTHFYLLNFHWMPIKDRVAVASFFVELNKKRKGKLTYKDVQPFLSKFKGNQVLRMYIIDNVSQKVIEMPDDMFLTAAAVPSEDFIKGTK